MKKIVMFSGLLAFTVLAHAQNQVSWVASTGFDANTCIRTSPCRTFAAAYGKTDAAGTIRVVDAADYGPLAISKAITIDGGTSGGMIAGFNSSAITIATGYTDMINIRNLAIHMVSPFTGIVVHSGGLAVINIENVSITADDQGAGILVTSNGRDFSTDTQVRLRNVSVAGTSVGITIANGRFTAEHLSISTRSNALELKTNLFNAVIRDSEFHSTNNGTAVTVNTDDQTILNRTVLIEHSDISESATGVYVCQNKPSVKMTVRLTDNVITGNSIGVSQCNAQQLVTFRNNILEGNEVDGSLVVGSTFK